MHQPKNVVFIDILFLCCILSEINNKQSESWLLALQTTHSVSFCVIVRELHNISQKKCSFHQKDLCYLVIYIENPALITQLLFPRKPVTCRFFAVISVPGSKGGEKAELGSLFFCGGGV